MEEESKLRQTTCQHIMSVVERKQKTEDRRRVTLSCRINIVIAKVLFFDFDESAANLKFFISILNLLFILPISAFFLHVIAFMSKDVKFEM